MKPVREPESSRPMSYVSLRKPNKSCLFAAPCRPSYEEDRSWSEISLSLRNLLVRAFGSHAQGFSTTLTGRRSSCPLPSPSYPPDRALLPGSSRQCSLPLAWRHLLKCTKSKLGRGPHTVSPFSINQTATASSPTGCVAKTASWLHLLRVSPEIHQPERPSQNHTPKPDFERGRYGEIFSVQPMFPPKSFEIPSEGECSVCFDTFKYQID